MFIAFPRIQDSFFKKKKKLKRRIIIQDLYKIFSFLVIRIGEKLKILPFNKKKRREERRMLEECEKRARGRCEACYGESRLAWTRTGRRGERVFPLDRGIVIHDATVRRLIR